MKARKRYQNLYQKEKEKKQKYGPKLQKNLPKNEKQRLVVYS